MLNNEATVGYRLSPLQRRLWALQQGAHAAAYTARCGVRIEGRLDRQAFQEALRAVVRRHEILCTRFHCIPGMTLPGQVIAEAAEPALDQHDLSQLAPEAQAAEIARLVEASRSFDLQRGPLLHVTLARLGPASHLLLIQAPALCADGESLDRLLRELAHSYHGDEFGDEPIQYADVAEWQNSLLESEDEAAGRAYWRQRKRLDPHDRLPLEQSPAAEDEFSPRRMSISLGSALVAHIERLAASQGMSVSAFWLACWLLLFGRLNGRQELTLGFSSDGRNEMLQDALGLFERYLPISIELKEKAPFSMLWRQVDGAMREAHDWQDYFAWENSESEPSFFPLCFTFEEPLVTYGDASLRFNVETRYACTDRYKLKLVCIRQGENFSAALHYDAVRFTTAAIACFAGQLQTLLASAAHAPETPISRLDMLSEAERHQVLTAFNETDQPSPQGQCLHQLLEARAAQVPAAVAVVCGAQRLDYAALNVRANRLAHDLCSRGVGPEVPVGLCVARSPDMVVGMLGILKAGGAYVPLEPTYPPARLSYMLEDAGITLLLTQRAIAPNLPTQRAEIIYLDDLEAILTAQPKENPVIEVRPANLAYVIYTSGSTGQAKGVGVTHANVVHSTQARLAYYHDPVTCFLLLSSFAFDSSVAGIFWTLCQGGSLCLAQEQIQMEPARLGELIARERVSHILSLPSLYALLLAQMSQNMDALRAVIVAGEACPPALVAHHHARLPRTRLYNEYGPTEGTVWSSVHETRTLAGHRSVPIGRPIANARIYLLNDCLQPVPIGAPGELYIGGAGITRGYLKRPALTAERFVPDPFGSSSGSRLYRTGDLARFLPDGEIKFLGRSDHQVKVRGYRVELGEIEAVLTRHPAVQAAVVVAQQDDSDELRLVAYVVPVAGQTVAPSELRDFLRTSLGEYMVPASFALLDRLPRTANGKVDRRALPALARIEPAAQEVFVAPHTPVEQELAAILCAVLGLEQIGIHTNFFAAGGHSLLAIKAISRIREAFQMELPLSCLFDAPTVAGLSAALVQYEPAPGHVAAVAELRQEVSAMSDDEIRARTRAKQSARASATDVSGD